MGYVWRDGMEHVWRVREPGDMLRIHFWGSRPLEGLFLTLPGRKDLVISEVSLCQTGVILCSEVSCTMIVFSASILVSLAADIAEIGCEAAQIGFKAVILCQKVALSTGRHLHVGAMPRKSFRGGVKLVKLCRRLFRPQLPKHAAGKGPGVMMITVCPVVYSEIVSCCMPVRPLQDAEGSSLGRWWECHTKSVSKLYAVGIMDRYNIRGKRANTNIGRQR